MEFLRFYKFDDLCELELILRGFATVWTKKNCDGVEKGESEEELAKGGEDVVVDGDFVGGGGNSWGPCGCSRALSCR